MSFEVEAITTEELYLITGVEVIREGIDVSYAKDGDRYKLSILILLFSKSWDNKWKSRGFGFDKDHDVFVYSIKTKKIDKGS